MTASRTDASMPARKRVRVSLRRPYSDPALIDRTVDVRYSWEAVEVLADEGLIPDADYDIIVRQVEGSSDAG